MKKDYEIKEITKKERDERLKKKPVKSMKFCFIDDENVVCSLQNCKPKDIATVLRIVLTEHKLLVPVILDSLASLEDKDVEMLSELFRRSKDRFVRELISKTWRN